MLKKSIIFALMLSCFYSFAQSQVKEGESLDKIIAVVGNEIIMQSDLESNIAMLAQTDPNFDISDPDVREKVLDVLINDRLVITKAIEDSVEISDQEIDAHWEMKLNQFVRYYGSEKRIEDIYGMSIARLKYEYRDDIRKQLLAQKIRQIKFGEISVTPKEVEDFYHSYSDSIPPVPAQIELYHIVKNVASGDNEKAKLFKLAEQIRDSIITGGEFSDFAKRYSGDPGSAAYGGDLGWSVRGKFLAEFEKAAFGLRKGEISYPVESPFGYHIIETLDKNKDSIKTRHILFKFDQSTKAQDDAKAFLLELKKRVESGEDFETLAREYSDDTESKGFGGLLGEFSVSDLPGTLGEIVGKIPVGGVSEPLVYQQAPQMSFHIIYKKKFTPMHQASLENDYKLIEKFAVNYKQNNQYLEWVQKLRDELYWEKLED